MDSEVSQALNRQRGALSERIVARQYERQPEIWKPYGDPGREKSVRDAGYHLSYLSEAIAASDPSLFVDYVAWVKVLFAGLEFPDEVLVATLECTRDVVQETLPEEAAGIAGEYLEAGLADVRQAPSELPTFVDPDAPLAELARQYLDVLLRGQGMDACVSKPLQAQELIDVAERLVSLPARAK